MQSTASTSGRPAQQQQQTQSTSWASTLYGYTIGTVLEHPVISALAVTAVAASATAAYGYHGKGPLADTMQTLCDKVNTWKQATSFVATQKLTDNRENQPVGQSDQQSDLLASSGGHLSSPSTSASPKLTSLADSDSGVQLLPPDSNNTTKEPVRRNSDSGIQQPNPSNPNRSFTYERHFRSFSSSNDVSTMAGALHNLSSVAAVQTSQILQLDHVRAHLDQRQDDITQKAQQQSNTLNAREKAIDSKATTHRLEGAGIGAIGTLAGSILGLAATGKLGVTFGWGEEQTPVTPPKNRQSAQMA